MWRTSSGVRILARKEAQVFIVGLDDLVREEEFGLPDDEGLYSGVSGFDDLSRDQQFVLLADVADALLKKEVRTPKLTAINEAAIAAVYAALEALARDDPTFELLKLLREAAAELEFEEIPSMRCTDREEWGFLVNEFRDRILWDADWASDLGLLDLSPEASGDAHRMIGIDRDYYGKVCPIPSKAKARAARKRLRSLISAGYPQWT